MSATVVTTNLNQLN